MPHRRSTRAAAAPVVLGVALAATLAGCSPTVHATAAPQGTSTACTKLLTRLPATLDGLDRRATDAAGVVAWGDPEQILLRCGVSVPAVSSLPCITISGVDWLSDERTNLTVLTSYGRAPAVDVAVQVSSLVSAGTVTSALAKSVGSLPSDGQRCQ